MKINSHQKGFTIVELLVVIGVIAIIFTLGAGLLNTVLFGSKQQITAMTNVDQSVALANKFTNELRNCTNGVDGSFPIYLADAQQIIFFSNANGVTYPNRIRYYLSGTTLYKGIIKPSGEPLVYEPSSEKITAVQTDVTNGSDAIFTYYNGDYEGSGDALTQPVNVNNIKYIKITLKILKQTQQGSNSSFSVTAGGVVRNLKDNLGN